MNPPPAARSWGERIQKVAEAWRAGPSGWVVSGVPEP